MAQSEAPVISLKEAKERMFEASQPGSGSF